MFKFCFQKCQSGNPALAYVAEVVAHHLDSSEKTMLNIETAVEGCIFPPMHQTRSYFHKPLIHKHVHVSITCLTLGRKKLCLIIETRSEIETG